MHIGDIFWRRRQPRSYGPNRFVGDEEVIDITGERASELRAYHVAGFAGIALSPSLADADDCHKPSPPRRRRLGANLGIGLVMILPALRMTDDHDIRLRIGQH